MFGARTLSLLPRRIVEILQRRESDIHSKYTASHDWIRLFERISGKQLLIHPPPSQPSLCLEQRKMLRKGDIVTGGLEGAFPSTLLT